MTENQHGGKREGAGPPRKMVEPERVTITIERKAKDKLIKLYGREWQDKIRGWINEKIAAQ